MPSALKPRSSLTCTIVLAKFNREVVDRVRVDEANPLRNYKPAHKIVKMPRWLLLRIRKNLKPSPVLADGPKKNSRSIAIL